MTETKMGAEGKFAAGCALLIVGIPVVWLLYAVAVFLFGKPVETREQQLCDRRGMTCDREGFPAGTPEETKQIFRDAEHR